jgi:putative oxygen-independent coproporphyrinogen III oxidase
VAGPLPIGEPTPTDGSLPLSAWQGVQSRTFHAYLHVPFCRVRCGYCDFNTYTSNELEGFKQSDFASNIAAEIELASRVMHAGTSSPRPLSTVFFGGGTPTQLQASELTGALAKLVETFGILPEAEVTTEANPDNVTAEYFETLVAGGFTRVSLGMQSAVPEVLKTLDRTHNPANVANAVKLARQFGLQVSVDLIYGAPGETFEQWQRTIDEALALETDHISAYALIVEDGTKMARDIRSGLLEQPDEDLEADKYEYADATFEKAGLGWYELSNWSTSAETQSAHNIAYWSGMDWWGFGPGAHSHVGGVRWWNAKHPTTYSAALNAGNSPAVGREVLNDQTRLEERLLLESRLRTGLNLELVRAINPNSASVISQLIAEQLIDGASAIAGRLVLTLKGRLLADAVVRRILP